MKRIKIVNNPYLLFLPFLILYIIIVIIFPTKGSFGDEINYLKLAINLNHGFFSAPSPNISLGNGPGYPILLMPFVAFHLPLIFITILNAIFYYLSIILLFKSIKRVSYKLALILSLFWGCYLNMYEYLAVIYTETFTAFLITFLLYSLIKAFELNDSKYQRRYLTLSGFLMGYLSLTKPIFGYVTIFLLVGSLLLLIIYRQPNYKRTFFIVVISVVTTSPYLIYTYHLTDRIFYWGSNGGNNLYWMSTPYKGEYGSWVEFPVEYKKTRTNKGSNLIKINHENDFNVIKNLSAVGKDDTFKKLAINNIKSHPVKFIENCVSNIGRMIFNFPYSYKLEKPATLLRLPENGIILVFILFSLIPTIINWKKIFFPIKFLLIFTFLYLAGSILGSAETRMFSMIVPILLFWIAYIIQKSVKVKLKFT